MDTPPHPLSAAQHRRLVELVQRRQPALLTLARDEVNRRWLSDAEAEALTRVAFAEFLDHLGSDDEPDSEGVEADDLLGVLEMHRRGYWDE